MKEYIEFENERIFESEITDDWTEEEIKEAEEIYKELDQLVNESHKLTEEQIEKLEENLLKRVLGGAAGFLVGPGVGKVIAKALGVEKGVLYDMFTSRLVGAALGDSIAKQIKKKK